VLVNVNQQHVFHADASISQSTSEPPMQT